MSLKISKRSKISVFRALDILRVVNERIAAGEDIIHLEAGQPRDGAPEEALNHVRDVMAGDPRQGYTESIGLPALRERIARWYKEKYEINVPVEHVVVTMGASGAFLLTFLAAFEAGDRVALAAPCYPAYRNILHALDIEPVEIMTGPETNYQPTLKDLEDCGPLDGLIIASPSNPAGTIMTPEEIAEIAAWCEKMEVRLISDELYHGVTFDEKADTILRSSKSGVVVNSFSKYFAMTGWRLGWLVLPEDMAESVKSLAESLFVSPPTPSQHVALKVFDHTDILDSYVRRYKENLDILRNELPEAGFGKLSNAKGAFYLYVDVSDLCEDSEVLCQELLDAAKVALTPGTDFDPARGHQMVRISFAGPTEEIKEASRRLKSWYADKKTFHAAVNRRSG